MSLSEETVVLINEVNLDEIDIDGFKELLTKLSVDLDLPEGTKTILYSGEMQKINTVSVAKQIKGVRFIPDTELGKFMGSEQGKRVIKAAIKNEL